MLKMYNHDCYCCMQWISPVPDHRGRKEREGDVKIFLWMKILHVVNIASDWYPEESSWPITLEIEKKQAISFMLTLFY